MDRKVSTASRRKGNQSGDTKTIILIILLTVNNLAKMLSIFINIKNSYNIVSYYQNVIF